MKNLFDPLCVAELTGRLERLRPDSRRHWGRMTAGQAVAHCAMGVELALGDIRPPRMFLGRAIGGLVKYLALRNDDPIRRNAPTAPELVVADDRDFGAERARLTSLIGRFAAGGPAGCTTHPHSFFGRLTAEQWAVLMYKHVDHHLRQFGA